jgi:hypothetical protein
MADEITLTVNLRCVKSITDPVVTNMSITSQTTTFNDDATAAGEMILSNPNVPTTGEAIPFGAVAGAVEKWARIYNTGTTSMEISSDGGTNYHIRIPPGAAVLICWKSSATPFWKSTSAIVKAELAACERA